MREITTKIITDEAMQPVAVQIAYDDWLEIERQLQLSSRNATPSSLSRYAGSIQLTEDPLTYQTRTRNEWA